MAAANEKLKQQMQEAPEGYYDIERVEEAQKVIEMVCFFYPWLGKASRFTTV